MTIYGYKCRPCGQEYDSETRADRLDVPCQVCGGPITRKYSIRLEKPMQEHWNITTNSPISSDRQFRDELKRMSEQQMLKTGIPCNYEPVDPEMIRAHVESTGAVGLDATNRVRVAEGKRPIRI